MFPFILDLAAVVRVFFVSRSNLAVEILALRQQVSVLKRKRQRPKLNWMDRLFWIVLRRLWSHWAEVLLVVKPETVVGWHRTGFRLYWRWRSRGPAGGRAKISLELRELIQRMARENPTWGAPKIHGELLKLGLLLSERSVSRYLRVVQRRGDPGKRWLAFLHNHREAIVALDFFTVPTVSFRVLYCLFVIEHARRRILHFHVTPHPNSDWVVQQLREAFPETTPYRYAILERDSKFDTEVLGALRSMGLQPKRTSRKAPWQNGVAERWVGSCRRELLDHAIPLNGQHLRRLIAGFIRYYHADRIHDGLGKDTPDGRAVENRPNSEANVISFPRLGGLHHRYGWQQASLMPVLKRAHRSPKRFCPDST
jgi:putative transposase